MSALIVEVVFVIDASGSMKPCFEGLARHLEDFLRPLQGFKFKIRLGLLAMNVGADDGGGRVFDVTTLTGDLDTIYDAEQEEDIFTESPDIFLSRLRAVSLEGDENNLIALDMALDFPFGPSGRTRRVVAMFSDEPIEDGAVEDCEIARIPEIIKKIGDRRVLLFAAMPNSPALEVLASADASHVQPVAGGDGLGSVDFGKLMGQMAKSISAASIQGAEAPYQRALFGQDRWGESSGYSFDNMR